MTVKDKGFNGTDGTEDCLLITELQDLLARTENELIYRQIL